MRRAFAIGLHKDILSRPQVGPKVRILLGIHEKSVKVAQDTARNADEWLEPPQCLYENTTLCESGRAKGTGYLNSKRVVLQECVQGNIPNYILLSCVKVHTCHCPGASNWYFILLRAGPSKGPPFCIFVKKVNYLDKSDDFCLTNHATRMSSTKRPSKRGALRGSPSLCFFQTRTFFKFWHPHNALQERWSSRRAWRHFLILLI